MLPDEELLLRRMQESIQRRLDEADVSLALSHAQRDALERLKDDPQLVEVARKTAEMLRSALHDLETELVAVFNSYGPTLRWTQAYGHLIRRGVAVPPTTVRETLERSRDRFEDSGRGWWKLLSVPCTANELEPDDFTGRGCLNATFYGPHLRQLPGSLDLIGEEVHA